MNQQGHGSKSHREDADGEMIGRERDVPVVEEFRANGGMLGGRFAGRSVLLLHAKGARSGQVRVTPAIYSTDGERYVIAASHAGAPNNPAWYYNLRANPDAEIEVGSGRFRVRAQVVDEPERTRLFNQMIPAWPYFTEYQSKTARIIPVLVLTRV